MGYLTRENTKLDSTNTDAMQQWSSENSTVIVWLINSMIPIIEKTYFFLPTVKDVWDVIEETYSIDEDSS